MAYTSLCAYGVPSIIATAGSSAQASSVATWLRDAHSGLRGAYEWFGPKPFTGTAPQAALVTLGCTALALSQVNPSHCGRGQL